MDLVGGNEPRPHGPERLRRLALDPLAAALHLETPLGEIVADAEAGDVNHGVPLGNVAGAGTDDEGDLHLPVHVDRVPRVHDVVVGPDDAVGRLAEQDRLGRDLLIGLLRVVGEVEPYGNEIARASHGRPDPGAGRRQRQRIRVERTYHCEQLRRQGRAGEVRHKAGEIADHAASVHDAGLLGTGIAKSNELHGSALTRTDGMTAGGEGSPPHSLSQDVIAVHQLIKSNS